MIKGYDNETSEQRSERLSTMIEALEHSTVNIEEIARGVIASQPECRARPWRMLDKVSWAVKRHIPDGAHRRVAGRVNAGSCLLPRGRALAFFSSCNMGFDVAFGLLEIN